MPSKENWGAKGQETRRASSAAERGGVRREPPGEGKKVEQVNPLEVDAFGRRRPREPSSAAREAPRELQMRVERIANNIWDQLSPEARSAFEDLADEIMESG